MNRVKSTLLAVLAICLCGCEQTRPNENDTQVSVDYLRDNFQNPPSRFGVNCWWWWLNSNATKEAITSDLEAMKSRGFQGAFIFDAGGHNQRGNKDIPAGPLYGSEEWKELFVFALDEAKRLGLEMGFSIQSGWNLGGPAVTPEYAAKQLTFTEAHITGGEKISMVLEQPRTHKDYYKEIAVLAFPAGKENLTDDRISDLGLKLGFQELGGSAPDCRFLLENKAASSFRTMTRAACLVDPAEVVDLTSMMSPEGVLEWDAPEGEWNIMRIGYTCTRSEISTASDGWHGCVLDYMSVKAFDHYWDNTIEPIIAAAGEHAGTTLKYGETDSWECGGMNWTDTFAEEFQEYCGYDLKPYLPLIAGHVVGDIDSSNAFLADFRKTIAELVATNHYARFAERSHKHGMGIQPESAGPHAGPLDGIKNYGHSDLIMTEFWAPSPHRPADQNRFFTKQASSAAHLYGKKIVGAESFTTIGPHWNDELWHDQKSSFDHEICAGLNRAYFHTFSISPADQGVPGQEYFAGTHVNPRVTWWSKSGAFIDYMRRVQMLAQEGRFVADVLYYYGDHVPNVYPFKHSDMPKALFGFDYDVTNEDCLLEMRVKDGKIFAESGDSYRVLVLPDHRILSQAALEKVEQLVKKGATVIGEKPLCAVSLVGGENAAARFRSIADKVWGKEAGASGESSYGKGRVVWGIGSKDYLLSQGIACDFAVQGNESKTDYEYIHFTFGESDVYFVSNQRAERQAFTAKFRVEGFQPELWDALSGEIRDAEAFTQKDGLTSVPLVLEPYGSVFVIFNKSIAPDVQGTREKNYPEYEVLQAVEGAWTVRFDPEWGGPEEIIFPELMDWTTHSDIGIKYYSGTATYVKSFETSFKKEAGEEYFIELESVKDVGIASVKVNGVDKGVVWTKPFRVEITDALKDGENVLEIEVTNSWYNRVAGDEIGVGPRKFTQTNIVLGNDYRGQKLESIPLEPSGLLGPVTVRKASF